MSKKRKRTRRDGKLKRWNWKKQIKIEQNYICPVCGLKGTDSSLDIHHIINRCDNGPSTRENCVAVHRDTCHKLIHEIYGNKPFDPRTMKLEQGGC